MNSVSIPGFVVVVLLLGVLAQWLAWRIKIPSILLLLTFGLALGHWMTPDQVLNQIAGTDQQFASRLLFPLVSLSVAVILFEGGLTLRWRQLAGNAELVFRLIGIASLVTWVGVAALAHWLLGMSWSVAWLLGAILMVTGPTVIGPLLRQIRPNRRLTSVLQWEGILIDPIGAIAAVLVFEVISHASGASFGALLGMVLQTLLVGALVGFAVAYFLVFVTSRYWLPDYLHGVFFLSFVLFAFVLSNTLREESGLVAVTVLGIALANQKRVSVEHVLEFKENLRTLLIGFLFIVLGSRLKLSDLAEIGWQGIPFLLGLILVVRPLSIWIATIGSRLTVKERWFLSAVAPRGIVAASVASVFGLKLASLGANPEAAPSLTMEANLLGSVTFAVILGTVAFCGLGAGPFARKLGLSDPSPEGILFVGADRWVRELAAVLTQLQIPVQILDSNYGNFSAARMAGLSAHCVNALSEHVQESLELAGIGRVFAVTPNDDVNTLVVHEYLRMFSRPNMYQLPIDGKSSARWQSIAETRRGRLLFDSKATSSFLNRMVEAGGSVKATSITESFSLEDFRQTHGAETLVLMAITTDRRLKICTVNAAFQVVPGDQVIALVPPKSTLPHELNAVAESDEIASVEP